MAEGAKVDGSGPSTSSFSAPGLTTAPEWPWKRVAASGEDAALSQGSGVGNAEKSAGNEQQLSFREHLWDSFEILWQRRVEPSQRLMEQVTEMLRSRAELERRYGESLVSFGGNIQLDGNSVHGAVDAVIVNFRNRGEQSLTLADEIEQDIVASFEVVVKQHREVAKKIFADVQLVTKYLQERRHAHDKLARRYGNRCADAEAMSQDCLQGVSMRTGDRMRMAQKATMLTKQARNAEYEYYASIEQANRAQALYEQQMSEVLLALQDMEEKRAKCLRDGLRKLAVYEMSWLRNLQYDLEGAAKAAEDSDAVAELQQFIAKTREEVPPFFWPPGQRYQAVAFFQLGRGKEPRKMTPDVQQNLQVQQQIRQLIEELSPIISRLVDAKEGAGKEEDLEERMNLVRGNLVDPRHRAALCQVLRTVALQGDSQGTDLDSATGVTVSTEAFEALLTVFKMALDLCDQQNDAWCGRDLMVLAQLFRMEGEDKKPVSLLSRVYNHALWNKVTFWEEVLILALCEAHAAEAVWRRSLPSGSQFTQPAMTAFLQRFVGYMMAFGISFDQGRNSVWTTLQKNADLLGPTVKPYAQLLLSAYEVGPQSAVTGALAPRPESARHLHQEPVRAVPNGSTLHPPARPAMSDGLEDDFEAMALGVQAPCDHPISREDTPSSVNASGDANEEDAGASSRDGSEFSELGPDSEALRVLAEAQPKVDDVFT
mmetsp:Transcript_66090/g.119007  ORF Transcript_66090/g.119007 Transcript_66090/m.119007 type:complete len:712 (+) Transcript_66090:82-2217(+)